MKRDKISIENSFIKCCVSQGISSINYSNRITREESTSNIIQELSISDMLYHLMLVKPHNHFYKSLNSQMKAGKPFSHKQIQAISSHYISAI